MRGAKTILLYLSAILLGISAKSNVPVLIWDPQSPPGSVPSVPSMQSLSFSVFEKHLNDFQPDNLILFLQDTLSIEDMSMTAPVKAFSYLSEWILDHKALYLPSVEDPANMVNTLTQKGYHVQKVETGSSLAALDLKKGNNLVIVKLPDTKNNNDRSEALRKSDEVMASTLSKIDKLRNFKIVYTAVASSLPQEEEDEAQHTRISRSLKAADDGVLGMHYVSLVRVYIRNDMAFSYSDDSINITGTIPERNASEDSGTSMETTSRIVMKYPQVVIEKTTFNKVELTLGFTLANGDWSLDHADLHANIGSKSTFIVFEVENSGISGVPHGMSYSCSSDITLRGNGTVGRKVPTLTFRGLQVEGFAVDENKFGPSYDCVGFFTVPIWCGVLTTLLALTILLWGLYMLAEVKTMDRFDDPKGTPIVITNAQE